MKDTPELSPPRALSSSWALALMVASDEAGTFFQLRRSLCMDEAFANVDFETDQKAIQMQSALMLRGVLDCACSAAAKNWIVLSYKFHVARRTLYSHSH